MRVVSVRRGWWTRRISLAGSINAEIKYDPAGQGERVFVNGKLVVTTRYWHLSGNVAPHIDFHLETEEYAVPASIDVAASILRLLQLSRFELTVAGKTVYKE